MSSESQLPDEQELQRFLGGDSEVSRAYREAVQAERAPPELDAVIAEMAQRELLLARRPRSLRWARPMALAATLLLSLGLLMSLWRDPPSQGKVLMQAPEPQPRAEGMVSPAPSPASAPAAPPPAMTQPQAKATAAEKAEDRPQSAVSADAMLQESMQAAAQAERQWAAQAEQKRRAPAPLENRASAAPMMGLAPPPAVAASAGSVTDKPSSEADSRDSATAPAKAIAGKPEPAWQPPRFEGLQLGVATREQVRARWGEPDSDGVSYAEPAQADQRELPYDYYARIPGQQGQVEFYYERMSTVLEAVRIVLAEPQSPEAMQQSLGWDETPRFSSGEGGPCGTGTALDIYPQYLRFPSRGAYLYVPSPGRVEQLVYERSCGD